MNIILRRRLEMPAKKKIEGWCSSCVIESGESYTCYNCLKGIIGENKRISKPPNHNDMEDSYGRKKRM
jgi:hypothetical protein